MRLNKPIGVSTIKYTTPITMGAIIFPRSSPNFTQILFNGDNNFELSKPRIKKISEIDKDQILKVSPLKTGQIAIRRKTIKKSIPKLLFDPIFSIRTFYITKSLQNKIKKLLKLQLFI